MIACICQPEHLPWLGWFDKARQVDTIVLLDSVQYKKRYFENRNKIRTSKGWMWLTVPVISKGLFHQKIQDVRIEPVSDWQAAHWKSFQANYARAPHFSRYAGFLEETYLKRRWESLADLNAHLIAWGLEQLDLSPRVLKASELGIEAKSSELLARLCGKIGAGTYLSGISGKDYLDEKEFETRGITVRYQGFQHPLYTQVHGEFLPCMSFVDLLLNEGPRSAGILSGTGPRLEKIFT